MSIINIDNFAAISISFLIISATWTNKPAYVTLITHLIVFSFFFFVELLMASVEKDTASVLL